jgi:DNA uptake protein ComE-like DNA-binding protein
MKRRGIVLVAVLAVGALVAVIAMAVMFRMRAETSTAAASVRGEQAWDAAMSGVGRVTAILKTPGVDMKVWYDNPELFQNQLVVDDGRNRWYFTVWAEVPVDAGSPSSDAVVRYGPTDEAGKINLNTAPAEVLLALPNMTSELVDSLLDYRDADAEARAGGAEQDYYDSLATPYVIANGAMTTLDELLLVKGFNARLVYGEDANLNGLLNPNENDGDTTFPPDNGDGVLDRGLRGVATVMSSEPNVDASGQARVNLNAGPPTSVGLPQQTLDFIRLYLAEGKTFTHPSELLEMKYTLTQNASGGDSGNHKAGDVIESGVGAAELPVVVDRLTAAATGTSGASSTALVKGLVNINTASAEVLATLPGLDANTAQRIVETRRDLDAETRSTTAWLFSQGVVDAAGFKQIAPLVTARSYQYSVRVVGFGVPCGRFRVIEAVVDFSGQTPRIVYLRDLTRLGLPFAMDPDTLQIGRSQ